MTKIAIIMGSDSDLPVMSDAAKVLDELEIPFELTIISAHRTPERMVEFAKNCYTRGIRVIIAGAGGAAHLPGMVAALTAVPVIGVPVKTAALNGVDSLYSIVQMPAGVPVATVAIHNATNAGLLAAQILGSFDENVYIRVQEYRNRMTKTVLEKAERLENDGYTNYIPEK